MSRFNFKSMQQINETAQWKEMVILQVMKAEMRGGGTMFVTQPSISMRITCASGPEMWHSCDAVSYNKTNNLINTSIADYQLSNKDILLLVSYIKSTNTVPETADT